jgi:predicted naringenin-chalcone synthase
VALEAYLAKLKTQEATLTSPGGKAALGSFISALEKSMTETQAQATTTLTTAIGNLSSACM